MAHYSPEMLAAMRHDYENTDLPTRLIAAKYGISPSTLQTLVYRYGWARRSERVRDCPRETQLLQAAQALAAQAHSLPEESRSPSLPALGDERASSSAGSAASSDSSCAGSTRASIETTQNLRDEMDCRVKPGKGLEDKPPIERLEALVVKEIAAEEAVRDSLQGASRWRAETERCARTLSILAQTLRSLQQLRSGRLTDDEATHDADDMPADIDEFRRELARRIDAFVASRADAGDAGESGGPTPLAEV